MSTATVTYFYRASLLRRFINELDQALSQRRLQTEEHVWLQSATRPPVADDPDPVRVDRLMLNDDSRKHFELTAALMLSHELTDDTRTYLFTLARGIEIFSDRHALLAALRVRFASGDPDALFHSEKIDDDPFLAQMLAIVEQQADQVGQLNELMKAIPTLLDASTMSLARQLRLDLPQMPVDPTTHLLQIATTSEDDSGAQMTVQTLAQAAFDDNCNVQRAPGVARRFLDSRGLPASTDDAAAFSRALAEGVAATTLCYGELLQMFWDREGNAPDTPREIAIAGLIGSWRREFYNCSEDESLPPELLNALVPLLHSVSGDAPVDNPLRCCRLRVKFGDSDFCALAGTFVVQLGTGDAGPIIWFSPSHTLIGFADATAFGAFMLTTQGREQLRPALALQDQSLLQRSGEVQLDLDIIETQLFADRVDSILALQARNLDYVRRLNCAPQSMTAMIDDALDIRQLLDPRLMAFSEGRWRADRQGSFADTWLSPRVADSIPFPPAVPAMADGAATQGELDSTASIQASFSTSWADYVQVFDARAERLRQLDTVLLDHAEQSLQRYLCVLVSGSVRARDVCVQWVESAPVDASGIDTHAVDVNDARQLVSMDLVSLLLECVSGHRPRTLVPGTQALLDLPDVRDYFHVSLIEHMLERVADGFIEDYAHRFRRSRCELQRQGNRQLQPLKERLGICERAMRLDLALGHRRGMITHAAVQMAQQLLNRPVLSLRLALGVAVTEAFVVTLSHEADAEQGNAGAVLCDTLVVRQPLSRESPVLLWSVEFGWRQYDSLPELLAVMQSGLYDADRERWLSLLGARDARALRAWLSGDANRRVQIRLKSVDSHAIKAMQVQMLERQLQDVRQLCLRAVQCRFEAGLFTWLASATELDWQLTTMLDGLAIRIDSSIFEAMLPSWITRASVDDLKLYYNIFKRYYEASHDGKDFMFGIPALKDYTRERLITRLTQDFPDQALDPDQIIVTSRRYVSAFPAAGELPSAVPAATMTHRESLRDYAINRFVEDQDAALTVEVQQHPDLSRSMTPDYVRKLVSDLDVGAGYLAILREAFAPADPLYAERKRLFVEQLPPALLAQALPEKVVGKLSQLGYEFVARVLDMPDGIAREPLEGIRVIISPLQLVPTAGMEPDTVNGIYLICAQPPDSGSVVVYATYHPDFTFKEYASLEAFMDAIRGDQALQNLLLERIDPLLHRRYAHGGFIEPHLPFSVEGLNNLPVRAPGPVTVQLSEIKGNALHVIFTDALKTLLGMSVSNTVTNEQASHAGRAFLATLAFSQALTLLPSKVATLVNLWQSHTLFRASVDSASGKRWGQALSEFTAALGVMATARAEAIEESATSDVVGGAAPATVDEEDGWPTVFSWRDVGLSTEQRLRLKGLEANNVALSDMRHDQLLNLYRDKIDDTPYAVVAGKVYQVQSLTEEGGWAIVGSDGTPGPLLVLDTRQHWQLDLQMRLRGGGGVVTRIKESTALANAEAEIVIQASGMREIRRHYRDRARRIGQAHQQARRYLENCLDNLSASHRNAPLDPRVIRVIGDFFGVENPSPALLNRTEQVARRLLEAVMDPSLSPFTSQRFVLGTSRPGRDRVAAFVLPADPQRRLFLTQQFFRNSSFHLKPEADAEGFEATAHSQAATLIHELTHQELNTKDIAYLEPGAPYPDLLMGNTAANLRMRSQIQRAQDYRLSHRTQKNDLFTHYEGGEWRDVMREDALGFSTILRLTQAETLDEARTIFLTDPVKRSQVLFANADSVTLLILQLGRYNHAVSVP